MNPFITKYNGKHVGDGQCGTLVRQYWIEVDHTDPPSYPNSKDYWFNPVPGYDKITANPQIGDTAIYNGHGAYFEGHSAIYAGNGEVFEQNADPDGSPAHLFTRSSTYLLGYLRKKGTMTDQELHDLGTAVYRTCLHREPESGAAAISMGQRFVSNGTITPESAQKAVYSVFNSQEWKDQDTKLKTAPVAPTQLKPGIYKV